MVLIKIRKAVIEIDRLFHFSLDGKPNVRGRADSSTTGRPAWHNHLAFVLVFDFHFHHRGAEPNDKGPNRQEQESRHKEARHNPFGRQNGLKCGQSLLLECGIFRAFR